MSAKFVCSTLLLLATFVLAVTAGCVCNAKGTDYCAKCKQSVFVRPSPRCAQPHTGLDLPPIGNSCSCDKVFVEPAALPKPCNKKPVPKPAPCNCASSSYYPAAPAAPKCNNHYYKPAPLPSPSPSPSPARTLQAFTTCGCGAAHSAHAYPLAHETYAKPNENAIPADPVSISLALHAAKATAVPEAKLAYGFAKQPIDSLKKITASNIPEENLFKLKNYVITLKKPASAPAPQSEEVEDQEVDEFEETPSDAPSLTYQQLGYVPERFKNPKFRKISTYHRDDYYSQEAEAIPDKVRVDCGYRPGRIATYIKRKSKTDPAE